MMSKSTLAILISERHGLSADQARSVVEEMLSYVEQALSDQGKVTFTNFGTFRLTERKDRQGDGSHKGIRFIPATKLKEKLR